MLIRKNLILLLLFALHVGAEVFKTNEIPVVPADDLQPPPEDQESLLVRYPNDQQSSKTFLQRIVTWFGFNGNPKIANKKPSSPQKQQGQKQNGYVYENPAKPFSPPPPKIQQSPDYQPGYQYEDPTKIIQNGFRFEPSPQKLQEQPHTGYTYDPPQPAKLQQQPQNGYTYVPPPVKLQLPQQQSQQNGYTYDPPSNKLQLPQQQQQQNGYTYDPPSNKLQLPQQQQNGYTYDPPPAKLQLLPQTGYTYNPPPVKLQQATPTGYTYNPPPVKLQEPTKQPPFSGYNYDPPPVKLQQRPLSLNDLVSSAASPTAVYGLPPINPYSQAQQSDSFPCNKIPWLPMFPTSQELNMLRAKLQAQNPAYLHSPAGYQNIQPIARPTPEKFTQQLNAHTYLPPRQRPLRQPSQSQIQTINSLPLQGTAQPFKAPSSTISTAYLPSQKIVLPVETTQHNLVPIPLPNLSLTPVPPLYDPKPFTLNDAQTNGFYINGHLVTPTGLSTTSVQSLQLFNQNHPVTQPAKIIQPASAYGVPEATTPYPSVTVTYGTPTNTYGTPPVTYGPPTNTYGTPPIKLTAEVTESSVFGRFSASQPFTARPTQATSDQSRLSSSNSEQNSDLMNKPINVISDSAADASESTRSPQDANTISDEYQPILQVLHELNVTTTPQGFHYAASTEPTLSISSASQHKKKEKKDNKANSNRETPLDLLETPNGDRVPDFKFMRNTWKPLQPSSFTHAQGPSVVTTAVPSIYSSPVTPSPASASFQSHTPRDANTLNGGNGQTGSDERKKKIQIIIPYTSKSRPSPFKNTAELQSFESSAGWSNSQHHDDHNSEESQVISAATASPKPNHSSGKHHHSRYITNILAKNIRELLKREHLKNISTIDLEKLQKNIDGWTEQEYSMSPNRASTISLLVQPKKIPFEYLTTTQSIQDLLTTEFNQPTTEYPSTLYEVGDSTEIDDSQDEGEIMDDESEDENEIKRPEALDDFAPDEQEAIQQAEEIEDDDFKRLNYLKALENNQVSGSEHQIFYATNPPPAKLKVTTPVPPCSTQPTPDDGDSNSRTTVLPSADELWNRLKSLLSASDKGKEKVYIVTPQPYPYFESEKIASDDENEVKFKSPRFLVRPTPGVATGRSSSSFARLSFKPRVGRLQTTTVKTTWNDDDASTDPVTEVFHSSTHSHSVVNGHAHAQAFSYVTPSSFNHKAQNIHVDDETETTEENDDDLIESGTHRRSLSEYKH